MSNGYKPDRFREYSWLSLDNTHDTLVGTLLSSDIVHLDHPKPSEYAFHSRGAYYDATPKYHKGLYEAAIETYCDASSKVLNITRKQLKTEMDAAIGAIHLASDEFSRTYAANNAMSVSPKLRATHIEPGDLEYWKNYSSFSNLEKHLNGLKSISPLVKKDILVRTIGFLSIIT